MSGQFEFTPAKADQVPRGRRTGHARVRARRPGRGAWSSCSPTGRPCGWPGCSSESRLPILLANIQPEPNVTPAWDMADMTYNQGVHGAQDTANAMVRAGRRVQRAHRRLAQRAVPRRTCGRWARAAAAVTGWKSLKVAIFGYAMNDMGDIRVDESALVRSLGPGDPGGRAGRPVPGMQAVTDAEIARCDRVRGRAVRDRPPAERGGAVRPRPDAGGHRGDPGHRRVRRLHRALRRDRRGRPVPAGCRWPPRRR